jgi:hypothetical protein
MAINIITGFDSSSREQLDKRSGPYASTTAALAALDTNSRAMGLPIYVITNGTQDDEGNYITGTVQTYSFTGGIADADLTLQDVVGITAQQAADILANNVKVGITTQQAADIEANNAKSDDFSYKAITSNHTLSADDDGKALVTKSVGLIIVIPATGLSDNFNCLITTTAGNPCSISLSAGVVVDAPNGLSVSENETISIGRLKDATYDEFIIRP